MLVNFGANFASLINYFKGHMLPIEMFRAAKSVRKWILFLTKAAIRSWTMLATYFQLVASSSWLTKYTQISSFFCKDLEITFKGKVKNKVILMANEKLPTFQFYHFLYQFYQMIIPLIFCPFLRAAAWLVASGPGGLTRNSSTFSTAQTNAN